MSLAMHRVLLPLIILLLLLASIFAAGCVLPVVLPGTSTSPTPKPAISPTPASTVLPAPTAPLFIPMERTSATATQTPVITPEPTPMVVFDPTYRWEYKDVNWAFTMVIPEDAYNFFRNKPRTAGVSYADYSLADEDQETLQDVALKIKNSGDGQGYSEYDNAMNMLTFVQSLPYANDIDSTGLSEYPRYPIETLKDGRGDCEDKTILAAALLQRMGMDVVILMLPDHSAVGINVAGAGGVSYEYDGKRYYYCETTAGNWEIGDQPEELRGLTARVVPLERTPILGLQMNALSVSADSTNVCFSARYTVKNVGPGTAKNVELRVRVYDPNVGENQVWEPEQTIRLGDLPEGESASGETSLTVPPGELGQIACTLSGDNVETRQVRTDSFRAER